MPGYMPFSRGLPRPLLSNLAAGVVALAGVLPWQVGVAQTAAAPTPTEPAPIVNSALDGQLFYQLLIAELELSAGRVGNAYELLLEAARRTGDEGLFQRAVEIALQERAGDQALAAANAWRSALPKALGAMRYQAQIQLALGRADDAVEPLGAWLASLPEADRSNLISGLPRLLQGVPDKLQALSVCTKVLAPHLGQAATRTASRVSLGRMQLAAGNSQQALELASLAQADDAAAPGPVMLALEMSSNSLEAEQLVQAYLARTDALPNLRMGYVRQLTLQQRFADAIRQLDLITASHPKLPEPWLTLGALKLDLKQATEAETALLRYVDLATQEANAKPADPARAKPEAETDPEEDGSPEGNARDLTQAWLLLAQAAEQRGDTVASEKWLAKVENPQRLLDVQSRRATILAKQGKIKEARALIQATPERTGDDARAKLMAEAQMLRDVQRWTDAADVLSRAGQKFPEDVDVIYEWAMVEEKLEHWAEMERLLRKVIKLKPDHPHAHNALGYSLADRGLRLPEARELIQRALELAPGDPFITDSLGWVAYRMGDRDEAVKLLRQAWTSRPDAEIAAHLGEVLWAYGMHEEARKVWLDGKARDATNEVLRETLKRLKVSL